MCENALLVGAECGERVGSQVSRRQFVVNRDSWRLCWKKRELA